MGSVADPNTVAAMASAQPPFEALKKGQSRWKLARRLPRRAAGNSGGVEDVVKSLLLVIRGAVELR
jgi:putative component of toxin-antitoxin plasmid stabilization module